eukprot:comp11771_c0_seq1/m.6371 comp11771_c0_seq1/g.6371  ORF comp11771_c0_seq1/g.6371 comp11771_c0_seq1/m.6371 type:complete len:373 (-) comp11771_c0_seq1:96-1214(-)
MAPPSGKKASSKKASVKVTKEDQVEDAATAASVPDTPVEKGRSFKASKKSDKKPTCTKKIVDDHERSSNDNRGESVSEQEQPTNTEKKIAQETEKKEEEKVVVAPKAEESAAESDQEGDKSIDMDVGVGSFGESGSESGTAEEGKSETKKKKKVKGLTKKQLVKFKQNVEKTGVIYLSRIPPFMKPVKVRHIFSQYGEVGRVFLQEEDAASKRKRIKFGGNKKTKYTEGWVEFADKKVAKRVAAWLNNTNVGGKKSSYYHDDLWNIKYLPKFKWHHLTERIAYENAVREKKLALALSQQKKEDEFYLKNVDRSKMITEIMERKRQRRQENGEDGEVSVPVQRVFKQRRVIGQEDVYGTKAKSVVEKVLKKDE